MELPNRLTLIILSRFLLAHNVHSGKRSVYSTWTNPPSLRHFPHTIFANSVAHTTLGGGDKPEPKRIYIYDNALHGFSALLSKDELQALRKSPGFISAYADDIATPDTTHSYEFLSLNAATGIWPTSQYGKDVIIGVVDTGIWPKSPSFNDDGMTEIPAKWKGICQEARYFNTKLRAENPDFPITVNSARDTDGHGTHVASTAAGNFVDNVSFFDYAPGTARGVAPRARLAVYKVLWSGGAPSDILAGIDQAVVDGVDVLSISLSNRNTNLYENPLAIASFGAREKGILVSLSAGNRGPSFATLRSGIPGAVVVASGAVDRWFAGTLTMENGKMITRWSTFPAKVAVRNLPLIYNETLSACNSTELLAEAPDDSIIICDVTIENGSFPFLMQDLPESNVRAAIIIADDLSIFRSTSFPHPGVVITPAEAQEVINYMSSNSAPRVTIDFQETVLGTKPTALSDDSSRGLARSYQGILKPDILAQGVCFLAAYNPYNSGPRIGKNIFLSTDYDLLSGTSVACPHISGVAALLKAAHPEWSPAAIQSAMMTTANPLDNTKKPIREVDNTLATPLGIGSGLVDPNRALDPGLIYDASQQDLVNLVCSMNFTREQTQTITRSNYNFLTPSSELNYPSFIAIYNFQQNGMTLTQRFRRTVTNVGEGVATYKVTIEVPENTTIRIQPETLVFGKKYEKQNYLLTIRYRVYSDSGFRYGLINWVEATGKYLVRSPIMVTSGVEEDS
ncbi:Tripeptidyl-peptidase II [Handroanthus impetiginosus]|uniref:Tripeptidyl-peptidase II n=1 Tax=Handroanthus impetiginosus TaxID=429701 RepID=A0A2G9G618_9LAMI|nr:Tripeptidyl-peptidase II [Handroanthus impetiginosus]